MSEQRKPIMQRIADGEKFSAKELVREVFIEAGRKHARMGLDSGDLDAARAGLHVMRSSGPPYAVEVQHEIDDLQVEILSMWTARGCPGVAEQAEAIALRMKKGHHDA